MYEPPTKCISTMETIDIRASIQFIDFEGRSDGESIRKIITQLKPRQLVQFRKFFYSIGLYYVDCFLGCIICPHVHRLLCPYA